MWSPRSLVVLSILAVSFAAAGDAGAEERPAAPQRRLAAERAAREAGRGATVLRILEDQAAQVGAVTRDAGAALATVERLGRTSTASNTPTLIDTNLIPDRAHGGGGREQPRPLGVALPSLLALRYPLQA